MEGQVVADPAARAAAAARRRMRWMAPVAFLVTVLVVFALVVAIHTTERLNGPATIQSAGFAKPTIKTAARFSLPVLQPATGQPQPGSSVTMSSLRGKPVVLNMWSSTCSVCKTETPAVEAVAKRAGSAVTFVGVDTVDQKASAIAFLRRYGVTYLQLFDPNEKVASAYAIPGLPVTVFVSAQGKVAGEYLGALNGKTLRHYLTSLFHVHVPAA
jgi:thiol-disulfide isomerase/thioredoxin